jgi:DNA-binding response OmpR family regulator
MRAISAGATDYLVRPYRITSLAERIENILNPEEKKEEVG